MLEDYRSALRAGQRAYRARIARGQSPYLAVLDDVIKGVDIVAQEQLGLVEIPAESLVGTKTSGRHTAFAYDFIFFRVSDRWNRKDGRVVLVGLGGTLLRLSLL